MFQILWFGWETFSILENWSPSRADRFTRGGRNQKFHCISISIRLIILLLSMVLSSNFLFQNWVEKNISEDFCESTDLNFVPLTIIFMVINNYENDSYWCVILKLVPLFGGSFQTFRWAPPPFYMGPPPPPYVFSAAFYFC